jgi:hypothetical protein
MLKNIFWPTNECARGALCCQRGCKGTTIFLNNNHIAAFFLKHPLYTHIPKYLFANKYAQRVDKRHFSRYFCVTLQSLATARKHGEPNRSFKQRKQK